MSTDSNSSPSKIDWGNEALASVVVFLVALPLCMGIALASGLEGVNIARGLVTGIVGGLLVGTFAGSPLQVSGPAAGLAVLVLELITKDGWGLTALGPVVLAAGVFQLAMGAMGVARWFRAISPAVVQGMLAGIGVLIFSSQFHVMVDDKSKGGGLDNILGIPGAVYKGLLPADGSAHHIAALIGVSCLAAIILWNKFKPAKLSMVPAPLLGVVVSVGLAALFSFDISYVEVPKSLKDAIEITQPGTLMSFAFSAEHAVDFWGAAFGFAVIASTETLLCAGAVDRMHDGPATQYDKELRAHGLGNMLCGLLGALPMTGVIVRSSANVEAGAKTRWSTVLHGLWLLVFVAFLASVLKMIPTSALAAVLVFTGFKLAHPRQLVQMYKAGRGELVIFVSTVVGVVVLNLLTGVIIGFVLALIQLLWAMVHLDVEKTQQEGGKRIDIALHGAATFVRLPKLAEVFEDLPKNAEVHLHVGDLAYIDRACKELLETQAAVFERGGGSLVTEWDAVARRSTRIAVRPESQSSADRDVPPGASSASPA